MPLPETLAAALGPSGAGALDRLRTGADLERALAERLRRPPLPTRLELFDRLQGGGLQRGALIELSGGPSSGRFSLALAALGAATVSGEPAALVDPGDQLDPESARAAGVELKRLLWVRPKTARQALFCAEALVDAGFALVALDAGGPPAGWRRAPSAAWLRLARAARSRNAVLLLSTSARWAKTAADVSIVASRSQALWDRGASPPLLGGVAVRFSIRRRLGPPSAGTLSLTNSQVPGTGAG